MMANLRFNLIISLVIFMCFESIEAKVFTEWGKSVVDVELVPYIIGGSAVESSELYPWHVAIMLQQKYHGGGSLITDQFVLTATHVAFDFQSASMYAPSKLSIKAGTVKLNEHSKEIQVEKSIPYPGFNPKKMDNDICLFKLKEKISFSTTIRPVLLWDNANMDVSTLIEKKLKGTVAGWGLTENNEHSDELLRADLNFVNNQECLKKVSGYGDVLKKDQSFCALGVEKNVCQGDSGSGMFVRDEKTGLYYLRGLVSKGPRDCQTRKPSLFTDVVYYLKWIEKIALPTRYNLLGLPSCPSVTTDADSRLTLPGLVHLKYAVRKKLYVSACHGILISNEHVLTHADCVKKTGMRKLQSVGIGSNVFNDYSRPYKEYAYKKVNESGELAIITLNNKVQDTTVQPVCLPARPEIGKFNILFWRQKSPHPKYMQHLNVSAEAVGKITTIRDIFKTTINDNSNEGRLEAAPLVYTVIEKAGSHFLVRAIEKCPTGGCRADDAANFVDILTYREWIRSIVGTKDESSIEPPLYADSFVPKNR